MNPHVLMLSGTRPPALERLFQRHRHGNQQALGVPPLVDVMSPVEQGTATASTRNFLTENAAGCCPAAFEKLRCSS